MSLAELKQDYEEQVVVAPRLFDRSRDVMEYLKTHTVAKEEKVTIDMCVLGVDDHDLCWHVNMIEKSEDNFDKRKEIIDKLNSDLRGKYVFCLTLWKSKKQSREHVTGEDYKAGRVYVVNGVHSLQTFNGVSQGSVQSRFLLRCEVDDRSGKAKRKAVQKA